MAPFRTDAGTKPTRLVLHVAASMMHLCIPGAVAALAYQLGLALIPVIGGQAIDRALATGDTTQLLVWMALMGINTAILATGFRIAALLTMRSIQLVQHRLRITLSQTALHPTRHRVPHASGSLLSTSTNDVMRLSDVMVITIFSVAEAITIIAVAAMLLTIHWPLGLIVVLGAPAVVAASSFIRGPLTRTSQQFQTRVAETVDRASDIVSGYRVVKGLHAEDTVVDGYRSASQNALGAALRMITILGRYLGATNLISNGFTLAVAVVAVYLAADGQITIGELVTVVGLAQALQGPLGQITGFAGSIWAGATASAGRILDALNSTAQDTTGHDGSESRTVTGIRLNGPTARLQLPDIRPIPLTPGSLIGVRTDDRTAADLIAALLYPHTDTMPPGYRNKVTVCPHNAALFTGTVADNIALANTIDNTREPASDAVGPSDRYATVLHAAACDDFARLETKVGEKGHRLSGGQHQRLALARAFITDSPVLVLHDPTTAVDSVTETVIAARLPEAVADRACVVVTSSTTLLGACSTVIELPATSQAIEKDSLP